MPQSHVLVWEGTVPPDNSLFHRREHPVHTKAQTPGRIKLLLTFLFASAGILALAACNTTEGLGKDIEYLGESMQEAAD